jgi:hypothetical protein
MPHLFECEKKKYGQPYYDSAKKGARPSKFQCGKQDVFDFLS